MLPVASGILLSVHQKLKLQHAAWTHQPRKQSRNGVVRNNHHHGPTLEEASLNFIQANDIFLHPLMFASQKYLLLILGSN